MRQVKYFLFSHSSVVESPIFLFSSLVELNSFKRRVNKQLSETCLFFFLSSRDKSFSMKQPVLLFKVSAPICTCFEKIFEVFACQEIWLFAQRREKFSCRLEVAWDVQLVARVLAMRRASNQGDRFFLSALMKNGWIRNRKGRDILRLSLWFCSGRLEARGLNLQISMINRRLWRKPSHDPIKHSWYLKKELVHFKTFLIFNSRVPRGQNCRANEFSSGIAKFFLSCLVRVRQTGKYVTEHT